MTVNAAARERTELAVLGAMLLDNRIIPEVREILPHAALFSTTAHRTVYDIILDLHDKGVECDPLRLADGLAAEDLFSTFGGNAFIESLMAAPPDDVGIVHAALYAGQLRHAEPFGPTQPRGE